MVTFSDSRKQAETERSKNVTEIEAKTSKYQTLSWSSEARVSRLMSAGSSVMSVTAVSIHRVIKTLIFFNSLHRVRYKYFHLPHRFQIESSPFISFKL